MYQNQPANVTSELGFFDLLAMLWRRKWLILLLTCLGVGIAQKATSRLKTRWKSTAQMVVIQRSNTTSNTSPEAAYAAPLVENAETQVQMIQSAEMGRRTLNWLKTQAFAKKMTLQEYGISDEAEIQEKFPDLITVAVPKETNLLIITATGPTSQQCTLLANAVCQAFVDWKKEIAQKDVRDITANLETRSKRAQEQMLAAEQAETAFKKHNQLVDVPSQYKATLDQYLNRDAEVVALKQDVATQETQLKAEGDQLAAMNKSIREGAGIRDDTLAQMLQKQLNDLEVERSEAALKYTPEYPGVLPELDARIADLKARLATAVQGTLDNKRPSLQAQDILAQHYKQEQLNLIASRSKLAGAIVQRDLLKSHLAGVPDASMEYARLVRNADLARQLQSSLQSSLNAVHVSNDLVSGNVQVASEAFPPELPFFPIRSRNLLLGGMIGLGSAMLFSFLWENADHRIRTLNQARQLATGPVIGTLPNMSRRQLRALEAGGAPALALEAYSLARANLAMIAREALKNEPWTKQVILITSAVPGEGKSLTAAYMARSMARAGKSVVLVDADMRRPTMNRLFNTAETVGLADVLVGQVPLEDAIVRSDTDNLYVLHSGLPSRNPTELISMPQMAQTILDLRETADIIVVDTPACVAVADALLLAQFADCIVQVVGLGKVNEEMMRETTSTLRAAAPKTLVYFVNRTPREARHAHTKYYHYENRDEVYANTRSAASVKEHSSLPPAERVERRNDDEAV